MITVNNKLDYTAIIRSIGRKLIIGYIDKNSVDTGINGPYDDPETEVRNLSHLLVILSIEYLKFGKYEYKEVIVSIAERLLTFRGVDGIYKMRQKQGKDECNGVIGHAWLNEGYIYAYKVTDDRKYIDEAVRICKMHLFQPKIGLWGRPLKGNDDNAIDYTFNHQLWYAATLCELLQYEADKEMSLELEIFFKNLNRNLIVNSKGRIAHSIYNRISLKGKIKMAIKYLMTILLESFNRPSLKYKEIGYHVFNLMAFARLYNVSKDKSHLKSSKIINALKYIEDNEYQSLLLSSDIQVDDTTYGKSLTEEETSINIYGYPYNVPGLELTYCHTVFKDLIDSDLVNTLLKTQFEQTWNPDSGLFSNKCHDNITINYRVYEYYRYLEIM